MLSYPRVFRVYPAVRVHVSAIPLFTGVNRWRSAKKVNMSHKTNVAKPDPSV